MGQLNSWVQVQEDENNIKTERNAKTFGYDLMGNRVSGTIQNLFVGNVENIHNMLDGNKIIITYTDNNSFESQMVYLSDGALKYKRSFDNGLSKYNNQGIKTVGQEKREVFEYDNAGLLYRYDYKEQVALSREDVNYDCMMDIDDKTRTEWRYAYNPMGDREQRRIFYTPDSDKNWNFYPWM